MMTLFFSNITRTEIGEKNLIKTLRIVEEILQSIPKMANKIDSIGYVFVPKDKPMFVVEEDKARIDVTLWLFGAEFIIGARQYLGREITEQLLSAGTINKKLEIYVTIYYILEIGENSSPDPSFFSENEAGFYFARNKVLERSEGFLF